MNFLVGGGAVGEQQQQQQQNQSPAERHLRPLLFDESVHVLSTFELNQVASLTYNALACDAIFEVVEGICRHPLDHTPLTVQKALVVTKHVLIYGSEQTVNHAYGLRDHVRSLLTFNTVLMAQKQGGAMAFFQSIQGGGVDRGGPVREAAQAVATLLGGDGNGNGNDVVALRRVRNAHACRESLVPVGDDTVAFVTDEVRHEILKARMAKERHVQITSNLAKAEGGWGAGYASKDGRAVVGAAHGIDEMIKMAQLRKSKFSDDGDINPPGYKTEEEIILEELKAEAEAAKAAARPPRPPVAQEADLLGSFAPVSDSGAGAATFDLLDFGSGPDTTGRIGPTGTTGDLLDDGFGTAYASSGASSDPFGLVSTTTTTAPPLGSLLDLASTPDTNSLYGHAVDPIDPFAALDQTHVALPAPTSLHGSSGTSMNAVAYGMSGMSLGMPEKKAAEITKGPVMLGSSVDRFAALDALSTADVPTAGATTLDAANAESRILGFTTDEASSGWSAPKMGDGYSESGTYPYAAPPPLSHARPGPETYPPTLGVPSTKPISSVFGSYGMPMDMGPPVQESFVAPGSGHVATSYGEANNNDDDGDNPWVMGGTAGSGLQPIGPAPGAPPPPPPPSYY